MTGSRVAQPLRGVANSPAQRMTATAARRGRAADGARLYRRYLTWTPVLWLTGLLSPLGIALLGYLTWRRWPKDLLVNAVIWSWFSIGLLQALSSVVNGVMLGDPARGMGYALTGLHVMGWMFAGLGIAAGYCWRLNDPRAVTVLGGWILVFAAIAMAARLTGTPPLMSDPRTAGMPTLVLETPLSLALPGSDFASAYGPARFFVLEDTLGEEVTRLVLFFPWAPALGFAGAVIALISLRAEDLRWRAIGMAGGAVAVVFSWTRTAMVALAAALAVQALLRLPTWVRLVAICTALAGVYLLALSGFNPIEYSTELERSMESVRSDSSLARKLIYEKSWEGFLEAPILGHGWVGGESVSRVQHLPIGSHSSVVGLLYSGGLTTFLAFASALSLTLAAVIQRTRRLPRSEVTGLHTAAGLCVVLAVTAPYESLFTLTLPCSYLFTWIGGALRTGR